MSADGWLTYPEAAAALGLTPGSLRNRATREGWEKTHADGHALVRLPDEMPAYAPSAAGAKARRLPRREGAHTEQAEPSPDLIALQRRVAELEADLTLARRERDQERAERQQERERADRAASETAQVALRMAATVDESRAMAEADRRRAEAAEAERDAAIGSHRKEVERLGAMLTRMLDAHDFARLPRWRQAITPRPPSAIGFDTMAFRRDQQPSR